MNIRYHEYEYIVELYINGISVRRMFFKYEDRMKLVLGILANYYDPDNIVIIDKYRNRTRLKNYY